MLWPFWAILLSSQLVLCVQGTLYSSCSAFLFTDQMMYYNFKLLFSTGVGYVSQMKNGCLWCHFDDSTQLAVHSHYSAMQYTDKSGHITKYDVVITHRYILYDIL